MPCVLYWMYLLKPQLLKPCPQLVASNLQRLRIKLVSFSMSSLLAACLVEFQDQVRCESPAEAYP